MRVRILNFPILFSCHVLPNVTAILASTPTVSRGFLQLNISEWDFLHNQRKALGRWQGGEGIIIFHFIFIIFIYSKKFGTSLIFSSDNFREYLMISPRGSQDIGSCQNWIKEKWSEVFPSFETKIHRYLSGTRDEHDRVVCLSIMCGYNVISQGWEVKCFRKYFYCIFDISYYTNLHSLNCTPRIYD